VGTYDRAETEGTVAALVQVGACLCETLLRRSGREASTAGKGGGGRI
jgi:hypothetical protein